MHNAFRSTSLLIGLLWGLTGCARTPAKPAVLASSPDGLPDYCGASAQAFRVADSAPAPSPTPAPHHWQRLPGLALDIAAGPNGGLWVIGVDAKPGGYGIYRWSGHHWQQMPGAAVRIALDPQGHPWVVNAGHGIYRWTDGGHWQQMPGAARDIGIGADGSVWVIGTDPHPRGFGIYRYNGSGWGRQDGASGVRIAVGPGGEPWVISNHHRIYRRSGERWQTLPGAASDIGISAEGQAWITGRDPLPNGYGIYRWSGSHWDQVSGAAISISVGPVDPWVVGAGRDIYRTL